MNYELLQGDALTVLRTLPSGSVQMCCTSPPYYGLRSYLPDGHTDKAMELGGEETPEAYVAKLVEVFAEVKRVLHPSGTCWINIGDSYNGSGGAGGDYNDGGLKEGQPKYPGRNVNGLGPKQLLGIPWRLAFELQADGWILRSEIIWHKLAPMPESVTDRCTKAHEQVFLLAKSERYYFDQEAIREPHKREWWNDGSASHYHNGTAQQQKAWEAAGKGNAPQAFNGNAVSLSGANRRSVWTLGPEPYSGAHFAVMPTKLVEPCVLAGTSAHGCCAACGSPYERIVERTNESTWQERKANGADSGSLRNGHNASHGVGVSHTLPPRATETLGWQPTCHCQADVIPCTVLDCFSGSGTTLAVALKHGRRAIGIDLDSRNEPLVHDRIARMQPMLFEVNA